MGTLGRIAIGARGQLAYKQEAAWGVALAPDQRVDFVSESLNNEVGDLQSESIDPSRGISKQVRGTSNVGGDIAWEQNTEGYEVWYLHALGDAVTIQYADGGVRARVSEECALLDTALEVDATLGGTAGFVTAPDPTPGEDEWQLCAIYKDANGLLASFPFTYDAITDVDTFDVTTSATGGGGEIERTVVLPKGAWIIQYEGQTFGSDYWDPVFTHYIEAAKDLPEGLTIEVGRDVAFFTYSGMRFNTLENSYAAQEILQGTANFLGKGEYSGGDLNEAITAAGLAAGGTFAVKNLTEDPSDSTAVIGIDKAGGTIQIGDENGLVFTSYVYAPATGLATFTVGASIVDYDHSENEPVGTQVAWDTPADPPATDMMTSFQAGIYLDGSWEEVLSGNWTINNSLFADKYQMGERFRAGLPEQQRSVEGLIHVEFDNLILYHKFINGTEAFLEIRAVDDSAAISATGTPAAQEVYRQKHTLFPRIKFTGTTPQIGGPEMIEHDMNYTALRDPTNDMNEVAVIFVNTINRAF